MEFHSDDRIERTKIRFFSFSKRGSCQRRGKNGSCQWGEGNGSCHCERGTSVAIHSRRPCHCGETLCDSCHCEEERRSNPVLPELVWIVLDCHVAPRSSAPRNDIDYRKGTINASSMCSIKWWLFVITMEMTSKRTSTSRL